MENPLFIGIDLGTTGCKISLIHANGRVIDSDYIDYPMESPRPGFAEQNPAAWWDGFCRIANNLSRNNAGILKDVLGIGICGQMHTQVYLDSKMNVIRPAITWMDQRSQEIVADLRKDGAKQASIYKNTANFATNTYTAPKIAWVKRYEPDNYHKAAKILLAKDYLKYKLTGETITDFSDAAGTLLFDVVEKRWSLEMFDLFGINRELFPDVAPSALIIGKVSKEASRITGLPAGIPVINGCADHTAHALGAGIFDSGETTLQIGTSGAINVCSDKPLADPMGRTACWNYCLDDEWVILGLTQTAGKSLDWFKNAFDDQDKEQIFALYSREINKIPDGSEGLIYLPYLMGERSPHWDPNARGVFFGISLNHHKYHFVKAVLEGVAFSLRENLQIVESLGVTIDGLKFLGGASKSKEWQVIFAKILNKKIILSQVQETGARGCSILCGMALGLYQSLDSVKKELTQGEQTLFYPEFSPVYQKNYRIYRQLYHNLKDLYPSS